MAVINLRDYYPFYSQDYLVDVSEEIIDVLENFRRAEEAHRIKTIRHKAYYSLDIGDEIEGHVLFTAIRPDELYEKKVTYEELHTALAHLPPKQAERIWAYYFLGMSKVAIARTEGVDERAIRSSIQRGLKNLEHKLKKNL